MTLKLSNSLLSSSRIAVVEEKKEMDPQILALMEAEEKVQELITVLKKAEVAHANDTCDILVAKIIKFRKKTPVDD